MTPEDTLIAAAKRWADARSKAYKGISGVPWKEFRIAEHNLVESVRDLRQAERAAAEESEATNG